MTYPMPYSNNQIDRVMTQEQFELVVEAILAGKYSWACVLILRFGGYNPLHYIPYRTYNRLMKEHRQGRTQSGHRNNEDPSENFDECQPSQIKDLGYLEVVEEGRKKVRGGSSYLGRDLYVDPISGWR